MFLGSLLKYELNFSLNRNTYSKSTYDIHFCAISVVRSCTTFRTGGLAAIYRLEHIDQLRGNFGRACIMFRGFHIGDLRPMISD